MDEIRKLIRIVTNKAEKNAFGIDLDVVTDHPSLEEQLFIGARDGVFMTDEDAAQGLYQADATDHRFRMLKSRLKSKLLNLLFLVDFRDTKDNISWQYELESENHLQRAKVLFKSGEYEMTEKQVNKAIAISRECEFTNITIEALRMLRTIYSERCKPTDFYRVLEDLNTMLAVQVKEDEASNLFSTVNMNLRKSLHSRKNTLEDAGKAAEQLEAMYRATPTYNIFEKYYRMQLYYYELIGRYDDAIETTFHAENLLKENKINPLRFDVRFNYYSRTYSYLRAKDFDKGIQTASDGMEYFDRSSSNWFAHMENYMLLAMHSKSYKLASDLMFRVLRNPYIDKLAPKAQERWKLFHAYS